MYVVSSLAGQQDAKSIPEVECSTDLGCRTFLCWGYLIRINGEEHFASLITDPVALSSPAFHMLYSAYKLNKQGDNRQPWCTPFLIWTSPCPVPCPVLTVTSCPAYIFLRRKVRGTWRKNGVGGWFRERYGKNIVDKKIEERKRLISLVYIESQ